MNLWSEMACFQTKYLICGVGIIADLYEWYCDTSGQSTIRILFFLPYFMRFFSWNPLKKYSNLYAFPLIYHLKLMFFRMKLIPFRILIRQWMNSSSVFLINVNRMCIWIKVGCNYNWSNADSSTLIIFIVF